MVVFKPYGMACKGVGVESCIGSPSGNNLDCFVTTLGDGSLVQTRYCL